MNWSEHIANCINNGRCNECEEKKLKHCDDCDSIDKVKFRPQWENKCLCYDCRQDYATIESKSRSW